MSSASAFPDHGAMERSRATPAVARSPVSVTPPHGTVVGALEAAAADRAPLLSLHLGRGPTVDLDARGLLEGAWRFGRLLRGVGVAPGDRVPILLPTSSDFVHALLGSMLIGAVPAPLASPMTFGGVDRYLRNLAAVVEDADARALVTTARLRDAVAADPVLSARLRVVIVPDEDPRPPTRRGGPVVHAVDPEDTALLQYTSGTTGRPKGVVVSHRALVSNACAIAGGLAIDPAKDVGVSWLPLFHDMGLIGVLLTAVCHPYPIHLLRPESFIMQPRRWLELVSQVGGTISAAPNFAYDLCTARIDALADDVRLGTWRVALNGAEPVQVATVNRFGERFAAAGFPQDSAMPVYGLAESTLAVAFPTLARRLDVLHLDRDTLQRGRPVRTTGAADALVVPSVGPPVAGAAVRIVHDGGGVGEGVLGEVEVAGPSLMDGYFRNEDASAATLRDGWLRTGDLGLLLGGQLYLVGRSKDVIIKGGRNYYPHDVERVAVAVSGAMVGAAAFAEPNPDTGTEDLIVVVEARERDPESRTRIAKAVRGELLAVLGVKADRVHVCPFGAIPRTTSGKIQRAETRRRVRAGELP
jgi:fatty-acyl-CoA synthase